VAGNDHDDDVMSDTNTSSERRRKASLRKCVDVVTSRSHTDVVDPDPKPVPPAQNDCPAFSPVCTRFRRR
jgi:hypothetical protein